MKSKKYYQCLQFFLLKCLVKQNIIQMYCVFLIIFLSTHHFFLLIFGEGISISEIVYYCQPSNFNHISNCLACMPLSIVSHVFAWQQLEWQTCYNKCQIVGQWLVKALISTLPYIHLLQKFLVSTVFYVW